MTPPVKAVLQYRASPGFVAALRSEAPDWLEVVVVDEEDRARFTAEMADARVLLHVLEPVTAGVIASAPRLGLIQKLGVGVNTIDLEAARSHGVAVANMPGTNSQAVVEHTLLLMLAVLRRVVALDAATRSGRGWSLEPDVVDAMGEVAGRRVGLVGFGAVGSRLATVLGALGAEVVHTRARAPEAAGDGERGLVDLDTLLSTSDVVSLHLPLTAATRGMIGRRELALLRPGAVLVNTARGGLVDEQALVDALRSRQLAGAGLDVFAAEPVPVDHPLLGMDNVVVTPHLAWLTPETLRRSLHVAIDNCRRLAEGRPLVHQVVPAVTPPMTES